MYKNLFSHFINANKGKYHFASHSHHFWPDCTRMAQLQYWDDSAHYTDDKWGYFFQNKVESLSQNILASLNAEGKNITFAPNTHELIYRVMSGLIAKYKKIKIITTDSEFHSCRRQLERFQEESLCELKIVPTFPYESFSQRFKEESEKDNFHLAFYSQVFFNSGYVIEDIKSFHQSICAQYKIIDGYHSFMAFPIDLNFLDEKSFFTAGAYKYAGAGEGCCFLLSPKNCNLKPINTGWFADFGNLANPSTTQVNFSDDGFRFSGATIDMSAMYRFQSIFELFEKEGMSVEKSHQFVTQNMRHFLEQIKDTHFFKKLLLKTNPPKAHFIAFDLRDSNKCQDIIEKLKEYNILCDSRNSILRVGFAIYQDKEDILYLSNVIKKLGGEIK